MSARRTLRRFAADERGTTLVELALAIIVFLTLLFGVIDFGRVGYHYVGAERAVMQAARLATVLPPACSSAANFGEITRHPAAIDSPSPPRMGTRCRKGENVCAVMTPISCAASNGDPEAQIIWAAVSRALPAGATADALTIRYVQDEDLGFLGGPYAPRVEIELARVPVTGMSVFGLASIYGGDDDPDTSVLLPPMTAVMPGEGLGTGG